MIRLALALLLALSPLAARAQNPFDNPFDGPPGNDLDEIVERGWMLFGVYRDFPPYAFERDGELVGIDIDVGRLIAKELGVEARFRAVGADENVDDDLRNNVWKGHYLGGGVVNVMLHIPYNQEMEIRNELILLNGQYFNERVGLAWSKTAFPDYDTAPPVPVFRYELIGAEVDSISSFYLSRQWGGSILPKLRHYPNTEAAMAALAAGEITAVMAPYGELAYFAADLEALEVSTPPLPGLSLGEWTLGVAIRNTYRALGYAVDDAIYAGVQDGRIEAIFAEYGVTWRAPDW